MSKKSEQKKVIAEDESCCPSSDEGLACCHVEGMVQVDAKGQIYLPKNLRETLGIKENDKLVVVGMRNEGKMTSISLFKADKFDNMVKVLLGPVMKEMIEEQ